MPDTSTETTITGCHGCNSANVPGIRMHNFRSSQGDDHWLGTGVYFFGEGISNPQEDAKQWAIAGAWDKVRGQKTYYQYSVLRATIRPRNAFNMTTDDGKSKVNAARQLVTRRIRPVSGCNDHEPLRFLADEYGFDVLIQGFYIQFTAQRRVGVWSRMPNARVICVRDPVSSIDKNTIHVISTSLIP